MSSACLPPINKYMNGASQVRYEDEFIDRCRQLISRRLRIIVGLRIQAVLDLLLAIGHHLLIFGIFGIICAEFCAVRPGLSGAMIVRIASIDPRGGGTILTMASFGPRSARSQPSDCYPCPRL
jgi:hypothetical protein